MGHCMAQRITIAIVMLGLARLSAAQQAAPPARPVVRGHLIDDTSLGDVPRARLVLTDGRDTLASGASDSTGHYALVASHDGAAMLHLRRLGYRADSVPVIVRSGAAPLNIALMPTRGAKLATVAVIDAKVRNGFEARARRKTAGVFYTRADIATTGATRVTDIMRRTPGFAIADSDGVTVVVTNRSPGFGSARTGPVFAAPTQQDSLAGESVTSPRGSRTGCVTRIVVDGRLMDASFAIDEIPIADIEGIEVYRGAAGVPIEFMSTRASSACGMILIWRRADRSAP